MLAPDDPYNAIGSTAHPKTVASASNQTEPGLDPAKPVKRALPVVPTADGGKWKCGARCRCDRWTNRGPSRSCKPNRRLRWISVTATDGAGRDLRLTVLNPGGRDPAQDFSVRDRLA